MMSAAVRLLDRILSRIYRVHRFTEDPTCVFRISVNRAPHAVALPGFHLAAGAPVILYHVDNERVPSLPPSGADLVWALAARRLMEASWRALAACMQTQPELQAAQAVGAMSVFGALAGTGSQKLFERFGFTIIPYHSPLGRFGEFWENLYSWWLMGAYNTPSLRGRHLLDLQRIEMWMAREEFLKRFG